MWPDHLLTLGDISDTCPYSCQTKGRVSVSVFFPFQKESGTDYMLWCSTGVLCMLLSVSRPQITPSTGTWQLCWWTCPLGPSMTLTCPDPYQNTNQLWRMSLESEKEIKNHASRRSGQHWPQKCCAHTFSHWRIPLKFSLEPPVRINWQVNILKIKGNRTMKVCLPMEKNSTEF